MWVPNTCDSNVPSDPTAGSRFRAQSSPPGLRDWRSGRRRPPRHTRSDGRRPVRQLETGAAPQMFDVRQPPRELSEDATEVQPKTKVVREVLPALRHPAADATDPALRPAQALPTPCLSRPRRRYSQRWKYSSIPAKNRPSYGIAYV